MVERYGKLVRTGIPRIIEENGQTPNTRPVDKPLELLRLLALKLEEEVTELIEVRPGDSDGALEELADIKQVLVDQLQVIEGIGRDFTFGSEEIEAARLAKFEERGGFLPAVYLISVTDNTTAQAQ